MMTNARQQAIQVGTPKKLLIVILVAVLCFVVWNNYLRNSNTDAAGVSDSAETSGHNDSEGTRSLLLAESTDMLVPKEFGGSAFVAIDIDRLITQNPFSKRNSKPRFTSTGVPGLVQRSNAKADYFPNAAMDSEVAVNGDGSLHAEGWQFQESAPQTIGSVSAIVTGGLRPAALINDQVYFEKDKLGDEWLIREIRSSGIVLEPVH